MNDIRKRIVSAIRRADNESGAALIEVVIAAAAFTIILSGLLAALMTVVRAESSVVREADRRTAFTLLRELIRDAAGAGEMTVSDDGDSLLVGGADPAVLCCFVSDEAGGGALTAGGVNILGKIAKNGDEPIFSLTNDRKMVIVCFVADDRICQVIVRCPLNRSAGE